MKIHPRRAAMLFIVLAAFSFCSWAAPPDPRPDTIGCPVFPPDNVWNTSIDRLPVDPNSERYVNSIGSASPLHPDFGAKLWQGAPIGIPYVVVDSKQPSVRVAFDYADESDRSPYPIPPNAPVEGHGTGDSHVVVIDKSS